MWKAPACSAAMPSRTSGPRQSMRRAFSAPYSRALRGNLVVVGFVGLAQVGRVGVGDGALLLHPVQGGGGVEPAGEGNADFLADGQGFENYGHAWEPQ
jgi:hypothetical protein